MSLARLPKYARLETERRWLVDATTWPAGVARHPRRILDRYLDGGRLRLRQMIGLESGEVVLKLTKKYPPRSPGCGPIATIFLTREEHDTLARLPGNDLVKVRHYVDEAGLVFGVDVFEGPLAGLVTCELELDDADRLAAVAAPRWTIREVTADPLYTGGHLAKKRT